MYGFSESLFQISSGFKNFAGDRSSLKRFHLLCNIELISELMITKGDWDR